MGIREPTILIRIRRSFSLLHSPAFTNSIPLKLQTSKIIYSYNCISSNSFLTRLSPISIDPVKFMIDFSRNKNHVNDPDQSFAKNVIQNTEWSRWWWWCGETFGTIIHQTSLKGEKIVARNSKPISVY